ncbi:NUDIX domain-containing protein [Brevundimonas bullata]
MNLEPVIYIYPHPAVTTDIAAFTVKAGTLSLLLIQRNEEPFEGSWALPGGFLRVEYPNSDSRRTKQAGDQIDPSLSACASREAEEETGVAPERLEQFGAYGDQGRDPRGRVVTIGFCALVRHDDVRLKAASDARDARWFAVNKLPAPLAFDHDRIIKDALSHIRERAKADCDFILVLAPDEFVFDDYHALFEAVTGEPTDRANLHKRVHDARDPGRSPDRPTLNRYIIGKRLTVNGEKLRHRPPVLYRRPGGLGSATSDHPAGKA